MWEAAEVSDARQPEGEQNPSSEEGGSNPEFADEEWPTLHAPYNRRGLQAVSHPDQLCDNRAQSDAWHGKRIAADRHPYLPPPLSRARVHVPRDPTRYTDCPPNNPCQIKRSQHATPA